MTVSPTPIRTNPPARTPRRPAVAGPPRGARRRAPARPSARDAAGLTARVAVLLIGVMAASAAVTRLAVAAPARRWLDYPFTGVPARPGEAGAILAHNGRAVLGVYGLLLIAQLALRQPAGPGGARRVLQSLGEAILCGLAIGNVVLVGAGLGAYGTRMARATLPHGPVELAAFALALALYLQGRRRPLPPSYLVTIGAISVGLLAVAAVLETYVTL
jgi:hypothetical protein